MRGREAGLDPIVLKVTFNFWRGPRILRLGSDHSLAVQYAMNGLPAGSCFNDICVRVYAIKAFDGFVERNPKVDLSSYIDDDTVSGYGKADDVIDDLSTAAQDLHEVFSQELGVGLAPDKLMTFASDAETSRRLGKQLGILAGTVGTHVISLGCDLAPGGRRNKKGHLNMIKGRLKDMVRRHRILLRYRKALPRDRARLGKIYTTGVKPGLSFGDTVVGMTDAELKSARSVMLSFQAPRHAGVSCRAKTALVGDPMWRSMVAPAIAWAQAAWGSITKPELATFSVKQLCSMWRAVDTEGHSW